jgi:hypothetical protein
MTRMCIRPMPLTSSSYPLTPAQLRKNDPCRCLCGKPDCRDYDLKKEEP